MIEAIAAAANGNHRIALDCRNCCILTLFPLYTPQFAQAPFISNRTTPMLRASEWHSCGPIAN
jgi:hypothetical protein